MEDKILKPIQRIRLKCKKKVTSQNIFSFLNKSASFIDAKLFHEVLQGIEIYSYIFKTGRGKNESFFVGSHLVDNNKNIVSDAFSTENNTISPLQLENFSSPVTVKSPEAFTDRTYNNLETNTPKFSKVKAPTKARCDYILKQLNSQRHNESLTDLLLQEEIFLREEFYCNSLYFKRVRKIVMLSSK